MEKLNIFGDKKTLKIKALIAITDSGNAVVLKAEENIYENELFDGFDLIYNITELKTIPKEIGIYNCDICFMGSKSWTDCGYEYDTTTWLENIQKIELNSFAGDYTINEKFEVIQLSVPTNKIIGKADNYEEAKKLLDERIKDLKFKKLKKTETNTIYTYE